MAGSIYWYGYNCPVNSHILPFAVCPSISDIYPYTVQLWELEDCCNLYRGEPGYLRQIVTPINTNFWLVELVGLPDQEFAQIILRGLMYGFCIGFQQESITLKSARSNLISSMEHPEVIDEYIKSKLSSGHLARAGPVDRGSTLGIHISPIGVIPKKGRTNKWRLIMDLSSPEGHSVSDGISKELCSFHYTSVDEAANQVCRKGCGALLAKMDIKQAYCNMPVALEDRHLLGLQWNGTVYIDQVLPFGMHA